MGIISGALKELVGGVLSEARSQIFGKSEKSKKQKKKLTRKGISKRRREHETEHHKNMEKAINDFARASRD